MEDHNADWLAGYDAFVNGWPYDPEESQDWKTGWNYALAYYG